MADLNIVVFTGGQYAGRMGFLADTGLLTDCVLYDPDGHFAAQWDCDGNGYAQVEQLYPYRLAYSSEVHGISWHVLERMAVIAKELNAACLTDNTREPPKVKNG